MAHPVFVKAWLMKERGPLHALAFDSLPQRLKSAMQKAYQHAFLCICDKMIDDTIVNQLTDAERHHYAADVARLRACFAGHCKQVISESVYYPELIWSLTPAGCFRLGVVDSKDQTVGKFAEFESPVGVLMLELHALNSDL